MDNEDCLQFEGESGSLRFDPAQSYMISYGIDLGTEDDSLGELTASSAREVLNAFVSSGAIPKDNAQLFVVPENKKMCTIDGMRSSFCQQATKAGENGIFVFHFTGHGFRDQQSFGLAAADSSKNIDTLVKASDLNEWLKEANCEARKVFLIDSCYAGQLQNELKNYLKGDPATFMICGCAGNETTLAFHQLGYSSFSFFLSRSLEREVHHDDGDCIFPIQTVVDDLKILLSAFSSLLIQHSSSGEITTPLSSTPIFAVLGATCALKLRFAYLYDDTRSFPTLYSECEKWLSSVCEVDKPIDLLHERNLLTGRVLDAVICLIMMSIGSIQLHHSRHHSRHRSCSNPREESNLFVTALELCAEKLEDFVPDIKFSPCQIRYALKLYMSYLQLEHDCSCFQVLRSKINSDYDENAQVI